MTTATTNLYQPYLKTFVFFLPVVVDAVALVVLDLRFGSNVIYGDGFEGLRKSFLADLICLNREKNSFILFAKKKIRHSVCFRTVPNVVLLLWLYLTASS